MKKSNGNVATVSNKNYIDDICIFNGKSKVNNEIKKEEIKPNEAKIVNDNIIDLDQFEIEISEVLKSIRISPHIKGYRYTIEAVKMLINDQTLINSITKDLYPDIADVCGSSSSKVQSAIRHANEVAFSKGGAKLRKDIFGSLLGLGNDKLTPREFLLCLAEYFRT